VLPRVELATVADEPELRRLLRDNPMEGAIRVSLEREPDAFLAASIEGHPHASVVARHPEDGHVLGMGSRAVVDAFVNGEPRRVGYLSQLRVERSSRGRRHLLSRGYARLGALRAPDEERFDFTTIIADNAPALRLLNAGVPGLPSYRLLETLVTLVIPTWPAPRPARGVERADGARLAAVADCLQRNGRRFQLARRWTAEDLASADRCRGLSPDDVFVATMGGRVTACAALWDQRAFKQVVVRGYGPTLSRVRPLYNLAARLLRAPCLPDVGAALPHAHLSHLAVDGDDPVVFEALLAAALREAGRRGLAYVVAGFSERHPLLAVARRLRRCREYCSLLHIVHGGPPPELDGRVAHLEVATL
jgi:hypothetical protein